MQYGQTNGIPQGSTLMDFVAELVLNYADKELSKKIKNINEDFKILRYRDDYRIFVNNPEIGEDILKNLTIILQELGMKLNIQKTKASNNIVLDAVKKDKIFLMTKGLKSNDLLEELYIINDLSLEYPNSGSLEKKLDSFYKGMFRRKKIKRDVYVLISIVVDIIIRNPRVLPVGSAIISKLISFIENKYQKETINIIRKKFEKTPNIGFLDIWLQRSTIKLDIDINYTEKLCRILKEKKLKIWNSDWLSKNLKEKIDSFDIIDEQEIKKLDAIIDPWEITPFSSY
jgi:hypothetical protein